MFFLLFVVFILTALFAEAVFFAPHELRTVYAFPKLTLSVFLLWALLWAFISAGFAAVFRKLFLPVRSRLQDVLTVLIVMAPMLLNALLLAVRGAPEALEEPPSGPGLLVLVVVLSLFFFLLLHLATAPSVRQRSAAWSLAVLMMVFIAVLWAVRIPSPAAMRVEKDVPAGTPGTQEYPSVFLVVFDTMRRDVLDPYHTDDSLHPTVSRMAREGIVFEDAWTPVPYTSASHASMVFGVYPPHHGVRLQVASVPSDLVSLPGILADHGYVTGAVSANKLISRHFGYAEHFDFVGEPERDIGIMHLKKDHLLFNKKLIWYLFRASVLAGVGDELSEWLHIRQAKVDAESVVDMATDFIRGNSSRPLFLLLNFMEAHWPYSATPEIREELFRDSGSSWRTLSAKFQEMLRDQAAGRVREDRFTDREVEILRELYVAETEYLDAQLGRLIDTMRRNRSLDNAYLFLVSDHGELFGEDGLFSHSCSLDERLINVPVILWWSPGLLDESWRGKRFWPRVSLADIPHTICDLVAGGSDSAFAGDGSLPFVGTSFREDLNEASLLSREPFLPPGGAMLPPGIPYPRPWSGTPAGASSRDTVAVYGSLRDDVVVIAGGRKYLFEEGEFVRGWRSTERGWVEDDRMPPDALAGKAQLYRGYMKSKGDEEIPEDIPEYLKEHLRALGYLQ